MAARTGAFKSNPGGGPTAPVNHISSFTAREQPANPENSAGRLLATAYASAFANKNGADQWDRVSKLEVKNANLWEMLGQRDKDLHSLTQQNSTLQGQLLQTKQDAENVGGLKA
jgi:hypothetical protein